MRFFLNSVARDRIAGLAKRGIAKGVIGRANEARDARKFEAAAALYGEAARLLPQRADLRVQHGHMLKEIGDFAGSETAYLAAQETLRNDPDLAIQMGHLFKSAGRLDDAFAAYSRARVLKPGWAAPERELTALKAAGWRSAGERTGDHHPEPIPALEQDEQAALLVGAVDLGLSLELTPRPVEDLLRAHAEVLSFRRLGRKERTIWGIRPVLRGVEAFRGFAISAVPVLMVELLLNDQLIFRGGVRGGYALQNERDNPALRKFAFNRWIDLSGFLPGQYKFECRVIDLDNRTLRMTELVVIAPALGGSALPDSDGMVSPPGADDLRSLEDQINARPSMIRRPGRPLLDRPPRAILVQRADQLGDLVVSVPAIRRLREIFPTSLLLGVVSKDNYQLAATLGLFDELVVADFPGNEREQRRTMSLEDQASLARKLRQFPIDLAIDLSEAGTSRLLLPLAGSPVMVGFRADDLPGLDVDMSVNTFDKHNDHEVAPHAKKARALVEWVNVLMDATPNLAARSDLDRARLIKFGVGDQDRFAVFHAGARARFSRWPHYFDLARLVIESTDLHVIMMSIDPSDEQGVPKVLAQSGRFHLLQGRLDFDDFDALATFCSTFVGDDSGPKHLASLRGANVIGVQTARNNWNEWGQDTSGRIITRRVPCAGCLIQTDVEAQECAKDFVCLTAITPVEVFEAISELLSDG